MLSNFIFSQELNCEVVVEARQTGNENLQIFKTLQSQLTEFVNNTSWTKKSVRQNEKIEFFIFGHRHLPLEIKISESSKYINLGDWISWYLSVLNNVDAIEIDVINYLKDELSKI